MIIDKDSPIPQYFQLQTWLMEQIDQGIFQPGAQIPTEKELVQMAGLARATVRQAIGNLVGMGYLVRQRRLGTFVRDRGQDVEKRTIIGMCIPDIRTGYAPELARGVEDEAALNHHSLILCNTDDSYVKADHHAARLLEASVGGVILIPTATSDEKNRSLIQKFIRRDIDESFRYNLLCFHHCLIEVFTFTFNLISSFQCHFFHSLRLLPILLLNSISPSLPVTLPYWNLSFVSTIDCNLLNHRA